MHTCELLMTTYIAIRRKMILKWSFLILHTILYFLMLMKTWQFKLLNSQGVGPVWTISVSFVYTGLLIWVFSVAKSLILLIAWNSPCYLHFVFCLFLWLIKLKCTPHSPLELFWGIICNVERLKKRNLEPWITWET